MRRRRLNTLLAGLAALLALGIGLGAPAHAAQPGLRLDSPDGAGILGDPVLHIRGEAWMPSGGTVTGQLKIDVVSLDGKGAHGIAFNVNSNRVPFSWDYPTSYNGRYRITVTAYGRDGAFDQSPNEEAILTRDVAVGAKPGVPTGVSASTEPSRAVTVTWNPNAEPDIVGYQVQRRVAGSGDDGWAAAGNTAATTFTDTATTSAGGTYDYRVVAARSGAAPDQIVVSDPSAAKSATVPSPPPASTTPGGGNGGGGDGGHGGGGNNGGGGGAGSPGGGANGGAGDLARTGKADLSGFTSLLKDAQQPGARPGQPRQDDGTYDENLPFKPGEAGELGEDGVALGPDGVVAADEEQRSPLAFVAASLLVTVILMHLLWLKREVDREPAQP